MHVIVLGEKIKNKDSKYFGCRRKSLCVIALRVPSICSHRIRELICLTERLQSDSKPGSVLNRL